MCTQWGPGMTDAPLLSTGPAPAPRRLTNALAALGVGGLSIALGTFWWPPCFVVFGVTSLEQPKGHPTPELRVLSFLVIMFGICKFKGFLTVYILKFLSNIQYCRGKNRYWHKNAYFRKKTSPFCLLNTPRGCRDTDPGPADIPGNNAQPNQAYSDSILCFDIFTPKKLSTPGQVVKGVWERWQLPVWSLLRSPAVYEVLAALLSQEPAATVGVYTHLQPVSSSRAASTHQLGVEVNYEYILWVSLIEIVKVCIVLCVDVHRWMLRYFLAQNFAKSSAHMCTHFSVIWT